MGAWRAQSALTLAAPVKPEEVGPLLDVLTFMAADVPDNDVVPFRRLRDTHYARFFLTDAAESPDGHLIPAQLIFMSDFDGDPDAHLAELAEAGSPGIDTLYRHCVGYPAATPSSPDHRLEYLRAHRLSSGIVYVNTIGRTVAQIIEEAALREAIEAFLDGQPPDLLAAYPAVLRNAIQEFVRSEPALHWALTPAPRAPLGHRLRETVHLAAGVLAGVILLPIWLPLGLIWLVVLRVHEIRDASPPVTPDEAHLTRLRELEDHAAQNQFTALGFVKPGRFRRVTTNGVLGLIGFGARHIFNRGSLAGVKTIHFARWTKLDGGARIVFASNYDGSTESYMDDFIDKVAWGLNAVFSNGLGYPRTRFLVFRGARDEQAFKGYLRAHQLPTQVWYAAYDRLTALNIGTNARIRAGLSGDMSESQARAWLRLL